MSSPRDEREPQSAPSDVDKALAELRKKLGEVETSRARFAARTEKLQAELNAARAQVAWFHRQLFGQKAERISPAEIEAEFRQYLAEQELQANNEETRPAPVIEDELTSVQLLMDLGVPGPETPQARRGADETAKRHTITPSRDADDAPKPPPEKKKRKGHGRKKVPPTLREETVVIEPEVIPEGARQVGAEVSYRVGMRRPELVRFAIVRPKYAVDDDETATSKIVVAEPPHEMIPRGLFAPSGLAHIIANRHDRSVPFNRMKRFFADSGYEIPVSTLSGVAMLAVPLVKDLLQAMKAYAQDVAPYLAIDATGVLLQQPERCLRGHVWLRYIENVCVLVSFTERHDSQSASEQLDGWRCPTLADGAQVFDAKHRETDNPRAGCWSHGRRKLVYAAPTDGRALVGVRWINELFAIEREILDASPEQRLAVRAEAVPRRSSINSSRGAMICSPTGTWVEACWPARFGICGTSNIGCDTFSRMGRYRFITTWPNSRRVISRLGEKTGSSSAHRTRPTQAVFGYRSCSPRECTTSMSSVICVTSSASFRSGPPTESSNSRRTNGRPLGLGSTRSR